MKTMFSDKIYMARREELRRRVGSGLIVLPGNGEAPRNYFDNAYPFRQDSTFLYYFGIDRPDLLGIMDADSGCDTLLGNDSSLDDLIWSGPQPTVRQLGIEAGVSRTAPLDKAAAMIAEARRGGGRVHFILPYRLKNVMMLSDMLDIAPARLRDSQSFDLIVEVAAMREVKSREEIDEMERAYEIGYAMHTLAMRMTREGVSEREIAGAIDGVADSMGNGVSFMSIVTQNGQTLHNHNHDGVLANGRLLLVDAGGESVNGYCSDHTRTFPVSRRFTSRQRDIYNIVLAAHDHVARMAKPMMYSDLHRAAYMVMAQGLADLGLIHGDAAEAVEAGVMRLFMPHGLGHGLGMDVHDCEAMGERGLPGFGSVAGERERIDTCIMRDRWRLRAGTVMTDEPGIYFIPAYIEKWKAEGVGKGVIDYDRLKEYYDFGGIRIEDNLIITADGCRMMGRDKHIPVTVAEIEEFMESCRR